MSCPLVKQFALLDAIIAVAFIERRIFSMLETGHHVVSGQTNLACDRQVLVLLGDKGTVLLRGTDLHHGWLDRPNDVLAFRATHFVVDLAGEDRLLEIFFGMERGRGFLERGHLGDMFIVKILIEG